MFDAARVLGSAVRRVYSQDAPSLKAAGVDFNMSGIFGGQIKGEAMRLFQVYSAGNFIEATAETPYFQIGESKYGKPILDRILRPTTTMEDAARCALVSLDSTIRSNLSVGMPIDMALVRSNELRVTRHKLIVGKDPYFASIRERWAAQLRKVFDELPAPGYWS